MITEVRLQNFKSIADQSVTLKPLSVVVGANSSGKSTLIQSLLLLTQAIDAGAEEPQMPLNGDLVNLGYLESVRHSGASKTASVSVGVTVEFRPTARHAYWMGELAEDIDEFRRVPWFADFDVAFGGSGASELVAAPITELRLRASPSDRPDSIELALKRRTRSSTSSIVDWVSGPTAPQVQDVTNELTGWVESQDGARLRIVGLGMRGLLPAAVLRNRPESQALAEAFIMNLFRYRFTAIAEDEDAETQPSTSDETEFLAEAARRLNEWRNTPAEERSRLDRYIRAQIVEGNFASMPLHDLLESRPDLTKLLTKELGSSEGRKLPVTLGGRHAGFLNIACRGIGSAFGSVAHLGGLRAAPQPLYPTSNQAQRGHLGRDGEFTAGVLYALRDRPVQSFDSEGNREVKPLQEAVTDWASRLGLFSEVAPHHRGALGIDIAVKQEGLDSEIDITAVGLGVSQLLPVLLRCLLSRPDDIILLEQPELHLHPESQQQLAEFLLACSRSGRQLIVETHSEHLVNRLRLKAARDSDPSTAELIALVFAERNRSSGATTYRNVDLNPFGGLSEWPEGFMAEGIGDAREILEIGIAKIESQVGRDQ